MNEPTDAAAAAAVFAPLWSRKWLIIGLGILVAVGSYGFYRHKPPVFKATTELYFGSSSEEQEPSAAQGKVTLNERALSDQAALISSSTTTEAVRGQLRSAGAMAAARGKVHASPTSGSDFVTITAEARGAKAAAELANAYATTYIGRQTARHRRQIDAAIARTRRQLRAIEASEVTSHALGGTASRGQAKSGTTLDSAALLQAAALSSKIDQLESDLSAPGIEQIGPARPKASALVSPKPKRDAVFGLLLGVLLGSVLAFVIEWADRRLRSLADMETVFESQVLSAMPAVRSPVLYASGHPSPALSLLEPLRGLHTALALADMLDRDRERTPRVLLFVSAEQGDGKSTVIADLALVQREAGERVAIVEADLRSPTLAALLGVDKAPGLSAVLSGTLPAAEVLQRVGDEDGRALPAAKSHHKLAPDKARVGRTAAATLTATAGVGSLSVLVAGDPVANPPALLARAKMTELLSSLADEYDYVLLDAPAAVGVSDVMPLLRVVDGIVLVARTGHTRFGSAEQLRQLLTRVSSAPVLGIAAVGASRRDMRTHGHMNGANARRPRRLIGR